MAATTISIDTGGTFTDGFVLHDGQVHTVKTRRLAVALAIGLLIGLERGWKTREESDHQRTAGLRTFALAGLLGGICGLLSMASSPIVLAAGLLAFTGVLGTFSYLEATSEKNFSVTGVVAGILTFMLGSYAIIGNETAAVASVCVCVF